MAVNPDEDTEFNDALRQHGIIPPKAVAPPSPSPPPSPKLADKLGLATLSSLDELDDDAVDSDEERMIESYRRQRMSELNKEVKASRFGEVTPIGRDDYMREVTEASKAPEPDEHEKDANDPMLGTGVVCFLYKDGEPASVRLAGQLRIIAARYPRTKFVSIVGNKCIENYPDRHLPTLFLYRNGALRRQFVAYGKDRERPVEELEVLLMATNLIDPTKPRTNPAAEPPRRTADSDDDDDDALPTSNRPTTGTVNHRSKNLRSAAVKDDSDSDFDL